MTLSTHKIIINIVDDKYSNWKICLGSKLKMLKSNNIEIDCKNLELSCTDINEAIAISKNFNCKITSFCSRSSKTIVSSQALGFNSQFIIGNSSNNILNYNNKNQDHSKTQFHQGTLRSGEYLNSYGDLLILGDVNPGAKVSAVGNIMIWGKLLGVAHAGSTGNSKATISALQLRPVQLRIAEKVARGPEEKSQIGFAEQARIFFEEIVISPLESK